jgi:hypothetical protein
MAVLWLVNTEEAERHQGRNSKHPQMQLCKPDNKIQRPEGDPNGTSPKRNPGRGCGAAPDPLCGAPLWIQRCGTIGRWSRWQSDVTVLPHWSVLIDLLAWEQTTAMDRVGLGTEHAEVAVKMKSMEDEDGAR